MKGDIENKMKVINERFNKDTHYLGYIVEDDHVVITWVDNSGLPKLTAKFSYSDIDDLYNIIFNSGVK
ncbi:MAG: hypothetical protein WC175_05375 [Candidatus Dojkabacteria bacterium]